MTRRRWVWLTLCAAALLCLGALTLARVRAPLYAAVYRQLGTSRRRDLLRWTRGDPASAALIRLALDETESFEAEVKEGVFALEDEALAPLIPSLLVKQRRRGLQPVGRPPWEVDLGPHLRRRAADPLSVATREAMFEALTGEDAWASANALDILGAFIDEPVVRDAVREFLGALTGRESPDVRHALLSRWGALIPKRGPGLAPFARLAFDPASLSGPVGTCLTLLESAEPEDLAASQRACGDAAERRQLAEELRAATRGRSMYGPDARRLLELAARLSDDEDGNSPGAAESKGPDGS